MRTEVVSRDAAVLVAGVGELGRDEACLVCHWDEDVRVFCARPTVDRHALARVSRLSLLRRAGTGSLQAAATHALRTSCPALDRDEARRVVAALWSGPGEPGTAAKIVERVKLAGLRRAEAFLISALDDCAPLHPAVAVVAGTGLGERGNASLVERTLRTRGAAVYAATLAMEHAGAHVLCPAPPLLPYDCGVLIRRPGSRIGAGGLVLIRPESIGTTRASCVLEHPAEPGEVLEASAYIRRVDFVERRVSYEIVGSRTFAAKPGAEGSVRLETALTVGANGARGAATVSIAIKDLEGGGSIAFLDLPLEPIEQLDHAPRMCGAALAGAHWASRLTARAAAALDVDRSVEDWIGLFRPSRRLSRFQYLSEIIQAADSDEWQSFQVGGFVDAEPDVFQAEARRVLFAALCGLADAAHQLPGVQAWLLSWREAVAPHDAGAARHLLNALSAGGASPETVTRAAHLLRVYEFAASPPAQLNIDW